MVLVRSLRIAFILVTSYPTFYSRAILRRSFLRCRLLEINCWLTFATLLCLLACDTRKVFTTLALLSIIQFSMGKFFYMSVQTISEGWVSIKRLEAILLMEVCIMIALVHHTVWDFQKAWDRSIFCRQMLRNTCVYLVTTFSRLSINRICLLALVSRDLPDIPDKRIWAYLINHFLRVKMKLCLMSACVVCWSIFLPGMLLVFTVFGTSLWR